MTTTAATRIFLARLSGIGVFDPNGDQVGKVREETEGHAGLLAAAEIRDFHVEAQRALGDRLAQGMAAG